MTGINDLDRRAIGREVGGLQLLHVRGTGWFARDANGKEWQISADDSAVAAMPTETPEEGEWPDEGARQVRLGLEWDAEVKAQWANWTRDAEREKLAAIRAANVEHAQNDPLAIGRPLTDFRHVSSHEAYCREWSRLDKRRDSADERARNDPEFAAALRHARAPWSPAYYADLAAASAADIGCGADGRSFGALYQDEALAAVLSEAREYAADQVDGYPLMEGIPPARVEVTEVMVRVAAEIWPHLDDSTDAALYGGLYRAMHAVAPVEVISTLDYQNLEAERDALEDANGKLALECADHILEIAASRAKVKDAISVIDALRAELAALRAPVPDTPAPNPFREFTTDRRRIGG